MPAGHASEVVDDGEEVVVVEVAGVGVDPGGHVEGREGEVDARVDLFAPLGRAQEALHVDHQDVRKFPRQNARDRVPVELAARAEPHVVLRQRLFLREGVQARRQGDGRVVSPQIAVVVDVLFVGRRLCGVALEALVVRRRLEPVQREHGARVVQDVRHQHFRAGRQDVRRVRERVLLCRRRRRFGRRAGGGHGGGGRTRHGGPHVGGLREVVPVRGARGRHDVHGAAAPRRRPAHRRRQPDGRDAHVE
mmetsp:Transcript_17019/g.51665  ORF Transcript_17019/g.51665 Transcript_17019/m.51665 type:complete len:249 (+) Transcript_17019:1042-1788(+)